MVCDIFQSKWFSEQVEREASREVLGVGDRIGEVLSIAATIGFIAFIAIHQTRPTGFFTDEASTFDIALIYLALIIGMVPPAARFLTGHRNFARPLEALGMVVFIAVALYLLLVFPFDISRFAQPLPRSLEFLLDWVPESLAKWVMGVGVAASAFFAPFTFQLYVSVKRRLSEDASGEPAEIVQEA